MEGLSELASRELVRTAMEAEIHGAKEKAEQAEGCTLDRMQRICQHLIFPPKYDNPNGGAGRGLPNPSIFSTLLKYVFWESYKRSINKVLSFFENL